MWSVSGRAGLGATGLGVTRWQSSSSILSRQSEGLQVGSVLRLSVENDTGSMSIIVTHDRGSISGDIVSNIPGTAASSVTVLGRGLRGMDVSCRHRGLRSGFEGSEWTSESSVVAKAISGRDASWQLCGTDASGLVTYTSSTSYNGLGIVSVAPANIIVTGSVSVTIIGTNLRDSELSAQGRLGDSGGASSAWGSTTSITS